MLLLLLICTACSTTKHQKHTRQHDSLWAEVFPSFLLMHIEANGTRVMVIVK